MRRSTYTLACAALLLFLIGGCAGKSGVETAADSASPAAASAAAAPDEKIPVRSLAELPQHSYPMTTSASELLKDDAAFAAFASRVRTDLEDDFARYAIDDPATLRGMYGSAANLAMYEGRWADADEYLLKSAALQDKEVGKLTSGLVGHSLAATHASLGAGADPEAFRAEFSRQLESRVNPLPWDVVQDAIEARKGRTEYLSRNFVLGIVQANFDPTAAQGELGSDLARSLVGMRVLLDHIMPMKDEMGAVYGAYITANKVEKPDIWPARASNLPADAGLDPVMIGIWDSGLDVAVFAERVFVNPDDPRNGRDDDANGFVDDVNGLAFDVDGVYSTEMLHPLGDQEGKVEQAHEYTKGFIDLRSSIDSPEATATRTHMASLPPEEVGEFMTSLGFFGLYAHGTHVAGIALEGNPYGTVLPARITFDYHSPPQAMTIEAALRHADSYRATAAYFREKGVRVVNMSWGWTFKEIEQSLEANGVGDSAAARAEMAREMIDVLAQGLREAMAGSPDILFCVAAGNSDSDVEFDVSIPANFDIPNMIVVGAVDQAGDPTSFTSGGENVVVYASGFEVDSYVPGGERMKMSGTSMASPQVCNLAGKLFAVNAGNTPAEVKTIIEETATPHADEPQIRLVHPAAAVERAMGESDRP